MADELARAHEVENLAPDEVAEMEGKVYGGVSSPGRPLAGATVKRSPFTLFTTTSSRGCKGKAETARQISP